MTEDDDGTRTVAAGQAAQQLELRREEFRLAVRLGLVRTVPAGDGTRRRVERRELDRLRAAPDFPMGLRDRVRAVGTREAAALLSVTPDRFTKLARTGHLSPVRFYLNRYRAVVWLYLVSDISELALTRPALLAGRLPPELRERLGAHEDLRARNWRTWHLSLLLRDADDPWARAAAIASRLGPDHLAELVPDPYERAHLDRLSPPPPPGRPASAVARAIIDRLTRADDPEEIHWHRASLLQALAEARADRPAPVPEEVRTPAPFPVRPPEPAAVVPPDDGAVAGDASPAGRGAPETPPPSADDRDPAAHAGPPRHERRRHWGLPPAPPRVRAQAAPGRPATGLRPPGRRVRTRLLDRLQRGKGKGTGAAKARGWGHRMTWP